MDIGTGLVDLALLAMLFVLVIAIVRMRDLFAVAMLSGAYSLVSATWFVVLDAVDVAFTEAAVGAGISTALMLGAMLLTSRKAKANTRNFSFAPLLVCVLTGAVLIYATFDLPALGDAASPANSYVGAQYLADTYRDAGIVNTVTVILASYRGFDTLGETSVVFIAATAVALLLGFGERSLSASSKNEKTKGNKA